MFKTTPQKFAVAFGALILGGLDGGAAQSMPDSENGRYALSPIADGVVRLDTRTGAGRIRAGQR